MNNNVMMSPVRSAFLFAFLLAGLEVASCSRTQPRISFRIGERKKHDASFLRLRGGDDNGPIPSSSSLLMTHLEAVGVLDLRPDAPTPTCVLSSSSSVRSAPCDAILISNSVIGSFPISSTIIVSSSDHQDLNDDDEKDYDQMLDLQAAAAETAGTLCSSVCLLIAYDAIGGQTVLHRTSGVKLAAVVNGIRQRWHNNNNNEDDDGKKKTTTTSLTLLLFPSGENIMDQEEEWDTSGAKMLVDKIRTFFAMGVVKADEEIDITVNDPFESVNIVPVLSSSTSKEKTSQVLKELLLLSSSSSRSPSECDSTEEEEEESAFRSLLQDTYESMGGVDQISFGAFDDPVNQV